MKQLNSRKGVQSEHHIKYNFGGVINYLFSLSVREEKLKNKEHIIFRKHEIMINIGRSGLLS